AVVAESYTVRRHWAPHVSQFHCVEPRAQASGAMGRQPHCAEPTTSLAPSVVSVQCAFGLLHPTFIAPSAYASHSASRARGVRNDVWGTKLNDGPGSSRRLRRRRGRTSSTIDICSLASCAPRQWWMP